MILGCPTANDQVFQAAPNALILVLSATSDEETARQAVQRGAHDYLAKGHVDAHWLPRALRYVIERKAAQDAAAPTSPVAPKARKAPALVAENVDMRARCADCGAIESTRVVDTPGDTSVLGVIGGAVVGGVLGHQVAAAAARISRPRPVRWAER